LSNPNSPFSYKTYTKLFLAQVISLVGTGVTTIALALLAWELAGDEAGKVLGIALALKMVAYVFFAPIISTFAHKFSRRFWLIFLDVIRALIVLYLPFVTTVWEIYILLFLINLASAGFTPIFQATISDIVKNEQAYQKALSYSRLAYDLEQLLSPSFAALLLTFISFNALFVLDSITFIFSAFLILISTIPMVKKVSTNGSFLENLTFGVSSYLKTPRLKALFFIYITVALASAMMITNTVVYVSDFLQKGETHVALAMAISGLGSMLIALVLPKWLQTIQIRKILFTGAFFIVVSLALASLNPNWLGFITLWFTLGIGLSLIQVPAGFLVRLSCNESDSISYFSANFSLSHLCWMIAYPLAGFLGVKFGLSTTFLIFAFIGGIASIIAYKIYPNPDELELEHTHDELVHSHDIMDDEHHHSKEDLTHTHKKVTHKHKFVIDYHHRYWPS